MYTQTHNDPLTFVLVSKDISGISDTIKQNYLLLPQSTLEQLPLDWSQLPYTQLSEHATRREENRKSVVK